MTRITQILIFVESKMIANYEKEFYLCKSVSSVFFLDTPFFILKFHSISLSSPLLTNNSILS